MLDAGHLLRNGVRPLEVQTRFVIERTDDGETTAVIPIGLNAPPVVPLYLMP